MAVSCPNCGRPNADAAANCIYCYASLEGAKKVEVSDEVKEMAQRFLSEKEKKGKSGEESPSEKPAREAASGDEETGKTSPAEQKAQFQVISGGKKKTLREEKKHFWVVVAPVEEIDAELAKKAAEILGMEGYTVRTKLAAGVPMIIKKSARAERARALVSGLLEIGLDAYSVTEEQFAEAPPRLLARKVSLVTGGLKFEGDEKEEPVSMGWSDAYLVVKGRIQRKPVGDQTKRKKKSAPSAPPDRLKSYEVIDIYPHEGRGVRIAEGITDFSGLGQYMRPSSLHNLRWILKGITAASAPIEDDSYKQLGMVFKPPKKSIPELLRKSSHWGRDDDYMDNSRHFDEYSTLVYLNCKKLGEGL